MKNIIKVLLLTLICSVTVPVFASDTFIDAGLWTYHKKRDRDECFNESHDLLVVYKGNLGIGAYKNTHCKQAMVGMYKYQWNQNVTIEVGAVSGYPKKMHVVGNLVVAPSVNYRVYIGNVGVKLMAIPPSVPKKLFTLVGVGFTYKL